ncbi:39S ribosomal protein L10, mitochondrial isoform X2 [Hemicordylus capensis]|uniref:39S ribosomal protein L10, mitochondrial isoform X2 n=1 Tax=Hemicordylus capensis TaxID=884348 RepID=UPI0023041254|nr:39S ribosomal protein L10, mitochondrial isoform X2 [Hemicordylus capensis]
MAAVTGCCKRFCKTAGNCSKRLDENCKQEEGWLPTLQLIRHGSKAVTRHWKAMHIMRLKLMAVTEYIPPKPAIPETCFKPPVVIEEENGYAKLLRRQVEQAFLENKMIAVCQYNYIPGYDLVFMRHRLRKYNIHAKFFPNEIMRAFLSESKYKNLLPLFVDRNLLLVSPETRVQEMLRVLKNVPQINLLGAYIDNTILSKQGFTNYANLPSMVAAQGQVVGTLSLMTSQTSTLLQRGPVHLTSLLDQYVKQQSGEAVEAKEEKTPEKSEAA